MENRDTAHTDSDGNHHRSQRRWLGPLASEADRQFAADYDFRKPASPGPDQKD